MKMLFYFHWFTLQENCLIFFCRLKDNKCIRSANTVRWIYFLSKYAHAQPIFNQNIMCTHSWFICFTTYFSSIHSNVPRMKRSIRNLIASPQNNFRVFRNGTLVYSNECREHELQSLLYPYFRNNS